MVKNMFSILVVAIVGLQAGGCAGSSGEGSVADSLKITPLGCEPCSSGADCSGACSNTCTHDKGGGWCGTLPEVVADPVSVARLATEMCAVSSSVTSCTPVTSRVRVLIVQSRLSSGRMQLDDLVYVRTPSGDVTLLDELGDSTFEAPLLQAVAVMSSSSVSD